jgi:acyl carrier protein
MTIPANQEAIYATLTEIFNDIFLRDDIELTPALTAKDVPGWDSFKQIEIMVSVEEQFNIKLNTREIDNLKNVGDLADVIAKKIG